VRVPGPASTVVLQLAQGTCSKLFEKGFHSAYDQSECESPSALMTLCLFRAYRPEGDVRFKRKVGEASPLCTLQSRANRDGSPTIVARLALKLAPMV
jgi:hypothetical protein